MIQKICRKQIPQRYLDIFMYSFQDYNLIYKFGHDIVVVVDPTCKKLSQEEYNSRYYCFCVEKDFISYCDGNYNSYRVY